MLHLIQLNLGRTNWNRKNTTYKMASAADGIRSSIHETHLNCSPQREHLVSWVSSILILHFMKNRIPQYYWQCNHIHGLRFTHELRLCSSSWQISLLQLKFGFVRHTLWSTFLLRRTQFCYLSIKIAALDHLFIFWTSFQIIKLYDILVSCFL